MCFESGTVNLRRDMGGNCGVLGAETVVVEVVRRRRVEWSGVEWKHE